MNRQQNQQNHEGLGASSYLGIVATLALVAGSIIHSARGQTNSESTFTGTVKTETYTGVSPNLTYTLGVETKDGTFVTVAILDGQQVTASSLDDLINVGDTISFPTGAERYAHQVTLVEPYK